MDNKLFEYYTTGKYKGFLPSGTTPVSSNSKLIELVLTDGQIKVKATGRFREEALMNGFTKIDRYLAKGRRSKCAV